MKLVLASSSVYRAELLSRLGLTFTQSAPNIDETRHAGEPPKDYVLRLAEHKARTVATPGGLTIGADQVAVLGDEVLGKPAGRLQAAAQLRRLSGLEVEFLTGLSLLGPNPDQVRRHCAQVRVHYRRLHEQQIHCYLEHEDALGCAASLRSEGLGISLLRRVQSDDPTALIGLPLITLSGWLTELGLDPLATSIAGSPDCA